MNEAFRSYVTSTSFNLTLRRVQIEALIYLQAELDRGKAIDLAASRFDYQRFVALVQAFPSAGPGPQSWVVTSTALSRRGLIVHDPSRSGSGHGFGRSWSFTDAGKLVVALLKESGLWQEYGGSVVTVEEALREAVAA